MPDQVYSTGRRKESIARVWVSNGTGNITINKKNINDYLSKSKLIMKPLNDNILSDLKDLLGLLKKSR